MHVVFRFVLAALASWRIAYMLAREDGPGDVFARIRRLGQGRFMGRLFGCVKCVGVWVSIPFTFFVVEEPKGNWAETVVVWLALAGIGALIDEWTRPPFQFEETGDDEMLRREDGEAAD
ncbi:MAG: DUF1360 domain-containing protein [Planctomycetes bacterium]|nr:DUF1360 domain-containing protein [Planctomycetota bacterium]MBL7041986.1 DUF1360 domain-containing protein [Pirellulaceae bacterium]